MPSTRRDEKLLCIPILRTSAQIPVAQVFDSCVRSCVTSTIDQHSIPSVSIAIDTIANPWTPWDVGAVQSYWNLAAILSKFGLDPGGLRLDSDQNPIDTCGVELVCVMVIVHAHRVLRNGCSGYQNRVYIYRGCYPMHPCATTSPPSNLRDCIVTGMHSASAHDDKLRGAL